MCSGKITDVWSCEFQKRRLLELTPSRTQPQLSAGPVRFRTALYRCVRIALVVALCTCVVAAQDAVPILLYHRLGPVRADSMTVTTEHFREQLDLLEKEHFTVIPLARFMAWRLRQAPPPPPGSVLLTFDDGHESVYQYARPLLVERRLPVTLFIYPSCISNAPYAMTWQQLHELAAISSFDVQSHTYWHPNFKQESRKLDAKSYAAFVDNQLRRSKVVLAAKMNKSIDLLAWPFGIYDDFLLQQAAAAGYHAAFSIDCRAATANDPLMALPRCIVSDDYVGARFTRFLNNAMNSARQYPVSKSGESHALHLTQTGGTPK